MRKLIFFSWSGEPSQEVAKALRKWMPKMIQAIKPFLSSEDIRSGDDWFRKLSEVLDECQFGIFCLTRANLVAPWVQYEAGAIAKHLNGARVVPLLIDVDKKDVQRPLGGFQMRTTSREDMLRLVVDINAALGDDGIEAAEVEVVFNQWWPQLDADLQTARAKVREDGRKRYDVFLSAPMAALKNDAEYRALRAELMKVFLALRDGCGFSVFWAMEKIETKAEFDSRDVSVTEDLTALNDSANFLMVYTRKLVTSALFEAGYALAKAQCCHLFVRDVNDLPYLMQKLEAGTEHVRIHDRGDWANYDDIARLVKQHKAGWFRAAG